MDDNIPPLEPIGGYSVPQDLLDSAHSSSPAHLSSSLHHIDSQHPNLLLPETEMSLPTLSSSQAPKIETLLVITTPASDPVLKEAPEQFHHEGETSYEMIKTCLLRDYNIKMGGKTIQQRLEDLGLFAASKTAASMPVQLQWQLVLNELATDPNNCCWPANIKEGILFKHGVALPHYVHLFTIGLEGSDTSF
ncbi:hypothetical protein FRC01_011580 [Tulasnella sp. 417]|nr:hypothetical protein FRC01_011580 [Tulasnella sp. 417]